MKRLMVFILLLITSLACGAEELPAPTFPSGPDVTLIRSSGLEAKYTAKERTPEAVYKLLAQVCEQEATVGRTDKVILHKPATSGIYDILDLSRVADFSADNRSIALVMRAQHDPDGPPEQRDLKPGSPAIVLGEGKIKIHDITLTNDCYNAEEDGALIGWPSPANAEVAFERVTFNCHDWGIYDWQSYRKKVITFEDCEIRHARMGLCLMAGWGEYHVSMKRVHFYGDANLSKSYGASSGRDPVTGGLLGNVVRGHGTWLLEDCTAEMVGLREPYNSAWGCPRIAPFTNHYNTTSNPALKVTIKNSRVLSIDPGIATVVNDLDFRYGVVPVVDNSELIAAARGGTGEDGEFRAWEEK